MHKIRKLLVTVMSEDWLKSALILALLVIGGVGLWYGARMAYKFGSMMSHEHAVTLLLVSLLAAVLFPAASLLAKYDFGSYATGARWLGALMLAMELVTHMGYTFGQRHDNVTQAYHQQATLKQAQEAAGEQKARLANLERELADLTKANGWAATVSADALRAQLPGLNLAIEQEARRGGCGPVCLAKTRERDEVAARIGTVERRTKIQEAIDDVQRELNSRRAILAGTSLGNSAVIEQTAAFAKLANLDLNPSNESFEWTKYVLGILISVVTVLIAPAAFDLAVKLATMAGLTSTSRREEPETTGATTLSPANDRGSLTVNVSSQEEIWRVINNALAQPKRIAA